MWRSFPNAARVRDREGFLCSKPKEGSAILLFIFKNKDALSSEPLCETFCVSNQKLISSPTCGVCLLEMSINSGIGCILKKHPQCNLPLGKLVRLYQKADYTDNELLLLTDFKKRRFSIPFFFWISTWSWVPTLLHCLRYFESLLVVDGCSFSGFFPDEPCDS